MTAQAIHPLAQLRPAVDACLRDDPVVSLSSVQKNGRPHVAPVWFHWDGACIVAVLRPTRFLGYGGRSWERTAALAS